MHEKCKVNDVLFPSGCEAPAINLDNKNMKIGIFTGVFPVCQFPFCPFPFRLFPFRPTFLPISSFTVSPSTHFALYHFAPLPPHRIIFSPTYHFALLPIHPLPIRPMPSHPFIISPLHHFAQYHFAHLSCHPFIISTLCFSFTETADYSTRFPGIGAQTVTWYRVRIQRILHYPFLEELDL